MKIEIDREVDALYITLAEVPVARTSEAGAGVQLDFDASGRLIGVEVVGVSEKNSREDLAVFTARNLISDAV
ncbi:MAG: DUF2283 domain-containing protein [Deltaproteobacteria bacterium]|nr:DUF2283 domain-containing protein [Deltaproteobacteria bacterium]